MVRTGWAGLRPGVALAGICMLAACAAPPEGTATGAEDGATADQREIGTVEAAASTASVTIASPASHTKIPHDPAGNDLTVTVSVDDGVVGPGELKLRWLLDGVEVATVETADPYTFTAVPLGRHQVAARLLTSAGEPLAGGESLATAYVIFVAECAGVEDCSDGLLCSVDACLGRECRYGPDPGCCDHDLECPYGWHCVDNGCIECFDDGECDDDNPCTVDACGADGLCTHDPVPGSGCCQSHLDCDDGDACTHDSCDLDTHTCVFQPGDDPECCNVHEDCKPPNACMRYMCYKNKEVQRCRYGPKRLGCCTADHECQDNNPCTADRCVFEDPEADSGSCVFETDPAALDCCLADVDCDDEDPSTDDACVAHTCEHTPSEEYCPLPSAPRVVIHEVMATAGPQAGDGAEWIELYNTSPTDAVNLAGWTVETSLGESYTLNAGDSPKGTAGLLLVAGGHFVLGQSADPAQSGGIVPHVAYGTALTLADPLEIAGPMPHTITLRTAAGVAVDTVTWDASWPFEEDRSLELTHPFADNEDPASWRPAGLSKDPLLNDPYGPKALGLWGSPKNANRSSYQGLAAPGCPIPEGSHPCTIGRCDPQNRCERVVADGCCQEDADCDDGDPCSTDVCDVGTKTCAVPTPIEGCCVDGSACDDGNPCNLDRCIGDVCRHSPNLIDGCCTEDADCDDGDPCTVDICDPANHTCGTAPVLTAPGEVCCESDAECDDGLSNTADACDPATQVCQHTPSEEFCDDPADPCDDGNPCTQDACDLASETCAHAPIAGCCVANHDCPDDGALCTAELCVDHACTTEPVEGCCTTTADCDDGDPCTDDSCGGNVCHHTATEGCCETAADCDDGAACTEDACVGGLCESTPLSGCCDPGATQVELVASCGEDPDGADPCWAWTCTTAGACGAVENPSCCVDHADCDDGDACTADVCTTSNTCKHVVQTGDGCCGDDSDCAGSAFCGADHQCQPKEPDGEACVGDPECLSGLCLGGICTSPAPNGSPCAAGPECASTYCIDGVCCETSCSGACQACDLAGSAGTCTGCEAGGAWCDGGECAPKEGTGSTCGADAECASGVCASGVCCESSCGAGSYCDASGTCVAEPTDPCQQVVCDAGPGCTVENLADGTACSDGSACTQTDTCQGGTCTGADPVVCAALDACHDAGTCDPATGACSDPAKADGADCDDDSACTTGDSCQSGVCEGAPVVCTALDACHDAGTCDPATGVCSDPAKADGTPCAVDSICLAGSCEVSSPPPAATDVRGLASGRSHTCVLRDEGTVACWGDNQDGQLGYGTRSDLQATPVDVLDLPGPAAALTAYTDQACALLETADLYCWGWNGSSQLGDQTTTVRPSPVKALGIGRVTAASAGDLHSCAVREDGTVACWGHNVHSQLGDGGVDTSSATPVEAVGVMGATAVAAGDQHTCARLDTGAVWCWGDNLYGQSGQASGSITDLPTFVPDITQATTVVAGTRHTCALNADGTVQCWGHGSYGELGDGMDASGYAPVTVSGLTDAVALSAGDDFTCAVRQGGAVACWGRDTAGQIGDPAVGTEATTPVQVLGVAGAVDVAAGEQFACARHGDGSASCWGYNFRGQLGDGTTEDRDTAAGVVDLKDHARCAACDDGNPCTDDLCGPADGCTYETRPDGTACGLEGVCASGSCVAAPGPQQRVSLGGGHGVLLRGDGTAAAWGSDSDGQLGDGDPTGEFRTWPDDVPGLAGVVDVAAGGAHSCAAHDDGTLSCWGQGTSGQLGDGVGEDRATAATVPGLSLVEDVVATRWSTCALLASGQVFCWGWDLRGQIGDGTAGGEEPTPTLVAGLTDVVAVTGGDEHVCALREGGAIACWGDGGSGRLGNGVAFSSALPVDVAPGEAGLFHASAVAAGTDHTCAVAADGTVACWGSDGYGALGTGGGSSDTAVAVGGLTGVDRLCAGEDHTCALKADGTVWCWGRNSDGQLGDGTTTSRDAPVQALGLADATDVACGDAATCARRADGTFSCWGNGYKGALGNGQTADQEEPGPMVGLSPYGRCDTCDDGDVCTEDTCHPTDGCLVADAPNSLPCGAAQHCIAGACVSGVAPTTRLAAGRNHTCIIDSGGDVSCWGRNERGQLGQGDYADAPLPLGVTLPAAATDVAAWMDHTCALLSDGRVYCWGYNTKGQLGDGTTSMSPTPVEVSGVTTAVDVTVGSHHSCAVLADGSARCWGWGYLGRLGSVSGDDSSVPVAVSGLSGAVAVAAGEQHTCALRAGGAVECWGAGGSGRLGTGDSFGRDVPERIAPGSAALFEARRLAGGESHTCAVAADGTLTCWGSDGYDKLGTGGGGTSYTPVAALVLGDVVTVDVAAEHGCAAEADGTLHCWGRNSDGQLGDGTTTTRDTPQTVPGLPASVQVVATGEGHTCALLSGGALHCWGKNYYGQLGIGTTGSTDYRTPQAVTGW